MLLAVERGVLLLDELARELLLVLRERLVPERLLLDLRRPVLLLLPRLVDFFAGVAAVSVLASLTVPPCSSPAP